MLLLGNSHCCKRFHTASGERKVRETTTFSYKEVLSISGTNHLFIPQNSSVGLNNEIDKLKCSMICHYVCGMTSRRILGNLLIKPLKVFAFERKLLRPLDIFQHLYNGKQQKVSKPSTKDSKAVKSTAQGNYKKACRLTQR